MIYIYGANGMLGRYMCTVLRHQAVEFHPITREEWIHPQELDDSIIINCAGSIRQRNEDLLDMVKINSLFPLELRRWHERVVHISTDCVFSGKNAPYFAGDIPDATDNYGMTKIMGEKAGLVIRTSFIGEEKKNKLSLLEWCKSKKGEQVQGYINHIWSGVTALTLARFIAERIKSDQDWDEMIQVTSPPISKYELICQISEVYKLNLKVKPVEVDPIDRSLRGLNFPPIEEQLHELKDFYRYL